ncbi:MAG: site-specific integrase [Gammaproteobacteria bacterium]|nr:site-specific integrase [Gammaproteobacteria bacterium]
MASIRARRGNGLLFFDFRYQELRCREQTTLPDTPANRRSMQRILERIEAEIMLGTFEYKTYFPSSPLVQRFEDLNKGLPATPGIPLFGEFAWRWFEENTPRWKRSMCNTVKGNLTRHLIPRFGTSRVDTIKKGDILLFRAELAKLPGQEGKSLSADRINHVMTTLRMALNEAADRYGFPSPCTGIKPLKIPRSEVDPFTIEEVRYFLENVRKDFRNYYTVRFFSGMRTGEIDGLQWKYVDLALKLITVRETVVEGEIDTPKTQSSYRSIQMSSLVHEALKAQYQVTGELGGFVFCSRTGQTLSHRNVTQRIWYPTLARLGLKKRRPYQTRHTAATLWLAAGENPEWIARQLGHANTKMLFEIYSRYVPNLTRQDGSAFERLLNGHLQPALKEAS